MKTNELSYEENKNLMKMNHHNLYFRIKKTGYGTMYRWQAEAL